jgi:hypothetical protein
MQTPHQINEVVAYFMTEYPVDSQPALLEDAIQAVLERSLRPEAAQELKAVFLSFVQGTLIDEYNQRFDAQCSLRFRFLDAEGTKICGIGSHLQKERIAFQDAINGLSHSQFESLSALVLRAAGCAEVKRTPESHDQGIDAFGYLDYLHRTKGKWAGSVPRVTFLAQAKHYGECKVGTKDIREFVGTYALALHKVYSTIDQRYKDLELLPYAPTALIFMTTEEVPNTVKRVASRAGIVVLSSDDLFDILISKLPSKPVQLTSEWLINLWKNEMGSLQVAR